VTIDIYMHFMSVVCYTVIKMYCYLFRPLLQSIRMPSYFLAIAYSINNRNCMFFLTIISCQASKGNFLPVHMMIFRDK